MRSRAVPSLPGVPPPWGLPGSRCPTNGGCGRYLDPKTGEIPHAPWCPWVVGEANRLNELARFRARKERSDDAAHTD
jgi:hypothetical protein